MTDSPNFTTASFIDSIGVCAHLDLSSSSYGNVGLVANEMSYLGIVNARVTSPEGNVATYQALGQDGIKFDVIFSSTTDLGTNVGAQLALDDAIAPYIRLIEGPDEVDSTPISYQGQYGIAAADAFQRDLYSGVHNDPNLNGVAVLPFSVSENRDSGAYGNLSAYADYGNVHSYASNGVPPYYFLPFNIADTVDTPGLQPIVTETGNYTVPDHTAGVTEHIQATWLIDTMLDNYKSGVARTYTYQLMDPYPDPSGTNHESHYGEFNPDGSPKQSGVALHDLTSILTNSHGVSGDTGSDSLNIAVNGLPQYSGFTETLQKSNGNLDVAVWQEPVFWDSNAEVERPVTPANVTVSFGETVYQVNIFDPFAGTSAIASYSGVSSVTLSLGSDALIVEVTPEAPASSGGGGGGNGGGNGGGQPASPVTLGSGPDTIVVGISEDAWRGDAQFTLRVDGNQIGGVQTAAALHGSGASQSYTLAGTFGAGSHVVTATFLNDAYGGSASTDRNLYVDTVAGGGVTNAVNAVLLSNGSQNFNVSLPVSGPAPGPTLGSGPDAIGVGVSEDAWMGDAQFTLSVDGNQVGGVQTATSLHAAGSSQEFTLNGKFGPGVHSVTANFLNDAYAGTSTTDRNLYVDSVTTPGTTVAVNDVLLSAGPQTFLATLPGSNAIEIGIAGQSYKGNAQFTLAVDGKQVGGMLTANAVAASGQDQVFTVNGPFSAGPHVLTVSFINDLYNGTTATDRNLFIDSVASGGTTQSVHKELFSNSSVNLNVNTGGVGASMITSATVNAGPVQQPTFMPTSGTVTLDAGLVSGRTLVGSGSATAFILHAGGANGDTLANFHAGSGDSLVLTGYGNNAILTQVDPSTLRAASASGVIQDLIHLATPTPLNQISNRFA